MKVVHAADLHLDSPMHGLAKYDGAPVERVRATTREALKNLIQLCLDQKAKLLLIAGDVFDSDWRDFNTGLFFLSQLARLRETGCQVILIRGNHDSANAVTRSLALPDHVRELNFRTVETVLLDLDGQGLAVHGRSYPQQTVTENLVPGYPAPVPGRLNLGLLHANVGGRDGYDDYAPCQLADLVNKGYDYWALGHVHTREVLHREPWVVYSGCLQGRSIRETGAKGCYLLTIAGQQITAVEPVDLDVMRWVEARVELTADQSDVDACLESIRNTLERVASSEPQRLQAVRLILTGKTPAHTTLLAKSNWLAAQVQGLLTGAGWELWLEKLKIRTALPQEPSAEADNLRASVHQRIQRLAGDQAELTELAKLLDPAATRLGRHLQAADVTLNSAETVAELLGRVDAVLATRLGGDV